MWAAMVVGVTLTFCSIAFGLRKLQSSGWGLRTKVAYIPFDVYTYADIDSSEIGREPDCTGLLPRKDAAELHVYVNQRGGVRAGRDGTLTPAALERVAAIMDHECR
jgi:hypothetical protein